MPTPVPTPRLLTFSWLAVLSAGCTGIQVNRCADTEWRYQLEAYRYLERSDTIDLHLEDHRATGDR